MATTKYIRLGASKSIGMEGTVSRSVEDYLVAVYRLQELYGIARTSEVAKVLGVKPATATKVLQRLAREGYIVWEPYRGFKLSSKGLSIALRVVWRHRVAERFLHDILGFDVVQSHVIAHQLEHLPDEFFKRLYEYLGKPSKCPHGNPIPNPSELEMPRVNDVALALLSPSVECVVSRVLCFVDEKLIAEAMSMGIGVGSRIRVVEKGSDGMLVEVNGVKRFLSYALARIIRCEPRR